MLIPGHFTHCGMWDGEKVCHMTFFGYKEESFEQFTAHSDIGICRYANVDVDKFYTFKDRKYDWLFNLAPNKLYCSEACALCMPEHQTVKRKLIAGWKVYLPDDLYRHGRKIQ